MSSDANFEDVLTAVTDALLAGERDLDSIAARYDVPHASVRPLVGIVRRLHVTLVGVQPSERFVKRLKDDLIGTQQRGLIARVRYLPPRVQIAAGVVAIAGFMLFTRRRLLSDAEGEQAEIVTQ